MKRTLQILAVVLALATVITWMTLSTGRVWTRTEAEVRTPDPVTGLEGITYEKKFQPGRDFLVAGLFAAGVLTGASLLFRTKSQTTNS